GQELACRNARGGRQPRLFFDGCTDGPRCQRGGRWSDLLLCNVEIGLVESEGFDEVGVAEEDVAYLRRYLTVDGEPQKYYHQLRAQPLGARHGQSRAHTIRPGLVTGSSHDRARTTAADCDGPSCQAGVVALFDAGEERVHVDVHDLA